MSAKLLNIFFIALLGSLIYAQADPTNSVIDTLDIASNISANDSLVVNDSIVKKEEKLKDVVTYNSDEQVHRWGERMSFLLRNAVVDYTDMKIEADYIEINWATGDIYAEGKRDSLDRILEPTIFTQAGNKYEYDAFKLNFNTQIGVAYNARLEQGEGVIFVDRVKRIDSLAFATNVKYTTDIYVIEKKDTVPDHYIRGARAKLIDGKQNTTLVISSPQLVIEEVPTPLFSPVGFLIPMGTNRSAGILLPSFGERNDVGFYLSGMGFYVPFKDYADLAVRGEIYTKGSWGIHASSNYKKRYSYSGRFGFDYERKLLGIKGLDDFSENKNYHLSWTHTQDPKANPNLSFTASVNYMTSQYYRQTINNSNIINGNVYNNAISSSIALTKRFGDSPFTLSLTASHSQNNNISTGEPATIQMNLPQLTLTMNRITPFSKKSGGKKGLLSNLQLGYNFNLINSFDTNEDDFFKKEMWDDARTGAKHQVSLNTGMTLANYFPISFSAGYNEVWVLKTIEKQYDADNQQIINEDINGFDSYRTFNISSDISTNIYGTYISKNKEAAIQGIRHVISPSVGFSFSPDFSADSWGYYDTYRGIDGRKVIYSRFEGGVYGAPSRGQNASLNFGLRNNLEMKVRSKKDSTGFKKIKIFEYLDIRSSYNIAAEEFKWSPITVSGVTSLLDQKLRINFSASFDPYKVVFEEGSRTGKRIDEFGGLRLTNYSINTGYTFDNSTFGGGNFDSEKYKKRGNIRYEDFFFDEEDYAHFAIPWRLGLSLTHSYTKGLSKDPNKITTLNLQGSISPSPHWTITGRTTYDIEAEKFGQASLTFARDLRSFNITFSWVPFGQYKTWDFYIGIKANILRDALKYEEKSSTQMRYSNF